MQITNEMGVITIEKAVYQDIAKVAVNKIEGVRFISSIFDILGFDNKIKVQSKNQRPNITIEVEGDYGLSLPQKGKEIQEAVHDLIARLLNNQLADINVFFKRVATGSIR